MSAELSLAAREVIALWRPAFNWGLAALLALAMAPVAVSHRKFVTARCRDILNGLAGIVAFCFFAALVLVGLGLISAIVVLPIYWITLNHRISSLLQSFGTSLKWVYLGVVGLFLTFIISMAIGSWINRLYWMLRFSIFTRAFSSFMPQGRACSEEDWLQQFKDGNRHHQAYLLSTMSRHNLSLSSDKELLRTIEQCEYHVADEPARGLYWRKRHELEESLKQERVGSVSGTAESIDGDDLGVSRASRESTER
jgi:hypothetical protein